MASDMNILHIRGMLTKEASYRARDDGLAVLGFSIAVNKWKKKGDEWEEKASFFDVKAFGKLADSLRARLGKGTPVVIEGSLAQERWQAKDGTARSAVFVYADRVEVIEPPPKAGAGAQSGVADGAQCQVVDEGEFPDDVPF